MTWPERNVALCFDHVAAATRSRSSVDIPRKGKHPFERRPLFRGTAAACRSREIFESTEHDFVKVEPARELAKLLIKPHESTTEVIRGEPFEKGPDSSRSVRHGTEAPELWVEGRVGKVIGG